MFAKLLNRTKGLIFRITHIDNVPWILDHGLHCRSSGTCDPAFRQIGNQELIAKRREIPVPVEPHGVLSDYVPFYFTPLSPMHMKITTGFMDTPMTPAQDITILVSSVASLEGNGVTCVLTDRHGALDTVMFSTGSVGLDRVDWSLLQARDFKRTPDDPGKLERYQAEALAHRHVPVAALLGMAVRSDEQEAKLRRECQARSLTLKLTVQPRWYFR